MESRLSIAGQAVHPVLVMFPLGLFTMAVLFDTGNLLGGPDILGALAYWNIVAGLVGGILVVLASAIDLLLVRNPRAKRIGTVRNLMHMGVLILFAVILMLRMRSPERVAGGGLLAVELIALVAAFVGAMYGGPLATRMVAPAYAQAGRRG